MADIIEITDLSAPELIPYTNTAEIRLKNMYEPEPGIFIAESPKVIRTALKSGYEPISMLVEKKYIAGQAEDIISVCDKATVYTSEPAVLEQLTGFRMTQGVLCAMRRKRLPEVSEILAGAERVAVLEDIMNQTNIGAIFRSAAALGFDAVLLTPACSDPLYRRAVRVSMGTVFQLPWTYFSTGSPDYVYALKENGFVTAAMALHRDTLRIDDSRLINSEKLAVIFGTEGTGLKDTTIEACDHTVKIPMSHGVDSLNVAAASAVAFWQLGRNNG